MIEDSESLSTSGKLRNQWFAVQVKPRSEKNVALIAGNRGYEGFLPLQKVKRRWSDRVKLLELPLFSGYLFCRIGAENRLPLLTIPGVVGLVGIGKAPLPIEESEIAKIQAVVRSGLWVEPHPFLESGEVVQLEEGPLAGLQGVYIESRNEHRIVVSVSLLKRSVAIEIEREWVRPLRNNNAGVLLQASAMRMASVLQ